MSARDRILAKLRGARPAEPLAHPDPAPHYAARARNESKAERLARFRTGIEGFHADVHVTTEADWPALLARLCADKGVGTLLFGAQTPAGRRLDPATFTGTALRPWAGQVEDIKADLFHTVDAGFTQTRGAIAETGSLILWSSADEPRTLSLVPPVHVAVLLASRLYASPPAAMAALQPQADMPTNLLLVTGPSKTADIQQVLAYGAHGPKELIIVLVDDVSATQERGA